MRTVQLSTLGLLLAFTTGCAPDYSKPVGGLADAGAVLTSSSKAIRDHRESAQQNLLEARAIIGHQSLLPTSACAVHVGESTSGCSLAGRDLVFADAKRSSIEQKDKSARPTIASAFVDRFVQETNGATTPQQAIAKLDVPPVCKVQVQNTLAQPLKKSSSAPVPTEDDVLNAIDDYIAALKAVTNSADEETYKANASKLAASVGKLATTVGALAGGAGAVIGPVAQAIVQIGEDAYLEILKYRRYEALKAAVLAECIPIHNLALAEAMILTADNSIANNAEDGVLTSFQQAPNNLTSDERARLNVLGLAAASNVRARVSGDPGKAAEKFYALHNQLVIDVMSGKGGSDAFVKELGDLATDLRSIKDAVAKKKSSGSVATSN